MDQGNDISKERFTASNSLEQGKELFFDKTAISETPQKLTRGQILELLRNKQHIRFAELKKLTHWRQTSLWNLVRELEFCRFIRTEIVVDENNTTQKVIHYLETNK